MSSPEISLWTMTLNQAILDLFEMRSGCSRGEKQVLARNALAWFRSGRNDAGSFVWVCAVLDLNASTLRRKVRGLDRAAVRSAVRQTHTKRGNSVRTTSIPLQRRYNKPFSISKIRRNLENDDTPQSSKKAKKTET
jgi:hypothetical protein